MTPLVWADVLAAKAAAARAELAYVEMQLAYHLQLKSHREAPNAASSDGAWAEVGNE